MPLSSDEVVELTVKRKSSGGLVSSASDVNDGPEKQSAAAAATTTTTEKGNAEAATAIGDAQPKKRARIAPIPVEGPVEATLP